MKMLDREGGPGWMLGRGLQGLCPEAAKAIALGKEVEQLSIRRPARLTVESLAVCDRDPLVLGHGCFSGGGNHKNSAARGGRSLDETGPPAIRRKASAGQQIFGVLGEDSPLTIA